MVTVTSKDRGSEGHGLNHLVEELLSIAKSKKEEDMKQTLNM